MRRLVTYFNSLFLGVILGMIFLAIVHACPSHWRERIHTTGFMGNARICALRK